MAEKEVDNTEEDDGPIPTEEELKAKAAKLSVEEITASLKLIRELLADEEEDVTPEERKILIAVHDKLADEINKKNQGLVASLRSLPQAEFARMCWGHPCKQNVSRRAKSLKPSSIKEAIATRGTHNKAEYRLGKYNYNYLPKTVGEAKHKVSKMRTSTKRWAAATLIMSLPAALPNRTNPALKKWKSRRSELVEAKGQLYKLKQRDKTKPKSKEKEEPKKESESKESEPAAASETVILVPKVTLWYDNSLKVE